MHLHLLTDSQCDHVVAEVLNNVNGPDFSLREEVGEHLNPLEVLFDGQSYFFIVLCTFLVDALDD
jgi:hypothetical protein